MKIRNTIPTSQLIDDTGVLAYPWMLVAGLCLVGMAKAIEPPLEVFYSPTATPFGAGWSLARFFSSSWAVLVVLFMLGGGILGDIYGRRRLLLWGLGVMLISNIALLLVPNTLWHVLWRILAFVSAGVILPLTLAPLYIFFEGRQRAVAFSIYLSIVSFTDLLSIYHGRLVKEHFGWQGVYLTPTLITFLAMLIVYRSLPESRTSNPKPFQAIFYAAWTILALGSLYAVFSLMLYSGFTVTVLIVLGFVLAVGLGLIFWWRQRKRNNSLRKRFNHIRHIIVLVLCGVIIQLTFIGYYSLNYRYYRVVQNLSIAQTLLVMSPMIIGMLVAVLLIPRIWAHQQIRYVIATGFIFVGVVISVMAVVARQPYWVQILPLAMFGIGVIATKTIWTNAFFQILIDRYIGLNAGANSATLLVGGALAGVLTTELFANFGQNSFVRRSTSLTLSEEAVRTLYDNLSAMITSGEEAGVRNLSQTISMQFSVWYRDAYITGYALSVLVIALLCLVAALVIYWGIRATLMYDPDDLPLDKETDDQDEVLEEGIQYL